MNGLLRIISLSIISSVLAVGCATAAPPAPRPPAQPAPAAPAVPATPTKAANSVTLVRSPTCGCCEGHEQHLAAAGYEVSSVLTDAYGEVKDAQGIPLDMRSCHTSIVGRYFVEGHVPADAIEQLLREMPDIDGIALPGMPPGSPGMGGIAVDGLTVWAIDDGLVAGEFGRFAGVGE